MPWCAILYSLEGMFRDFQFSCSTTSGFCAQQWFWDYFRLLFGCRDDGIQTLLSKRHLLTYWYLVLSVILDWRSIYGRMVIYRFYLIPCVNLYTVRLDEVSLVRSVCRSSWERLGVCFSIFSWSMNVQLPSQERHPKQYRRRPNGLTINCNCEDSLSNVPRQM